MLHFIRNTIVIVCFNKEIRGQVFRAGCGITGILAEIGYSLGFENSLVYGKDAAESTILAEDGIGGINHNFHPARTMMKFIN